MSAGVRGLINHWPGKADWRAGKIWAEATASVRESGNDLAVQESWGNSRRAGDGKTKRD